MSINLTEKKAHQYQMNNSQTPGPKIPEAINQGDKKIENLLDMINCYHNLINNPRSK